MSKIESGILRIVFFMLIFCQCTQSIGQGYILPQNAEAVDQTLRTIGYYLAEDEGLKVIEEQVPAESRRARKTRRKFEKAFSKSYENMKSLAYKVFGAKDTDEMISLSLHDVDSIMQIRCLDSQDVDIFIEDVEAAIEGRIRTPTKEVLYAYQYVDAPKKEIRDGHFVYFKSTGHSKSLGINMKFKVPMSYSSEEGEVPTTVKIFRSFYGEGTDRIILSLIPYKSGDAIKDAKENPDLISEENLRRLFKIANVEFLSYKKVSIDGVPFAVAETISPGNSAKGIPASINLIYLTYVKNGQIMLGFKSDYSGADKSHFNLVKSLNNSIAKSILFSE